MECTAYPFNTLGGYLYADIFALHKGQWIFSRHKERTSWETQGGHIEDGETPLEAAKRELFEESGAVDFAIEPLCDYRVEGAFNGKEVSGNGQVYFARVRTLSGLPPESEMGEIRLCDRPPRDLTYPEHTNEIFPLALQKRQEANP